MTTTLDTLYSSDFPGREENINYFKEVSSTMDIAREMAQSGCPHLTVVIAERQVKGRGRLKRTWLSDKGGLYFTLVLRPQVSPIQSYSVNFIASLALTKLLRERYAIDAGVKWPNDVLVNGKKISGMLSEMEAEGDRVNYVNLGVGINVNNDPSGIEPKATSMKKILGHDVLRKEVLSHFLNALEEGMPQIGTDDVISEWKQYSVSLNQKVRVVTTHETAEGIAIDVDENGALLLKQTDGSIKTVVYGDCFLL